jgi:hypothetical protein
LVSLGINIVKKPAMIDPHIILMVLLASLAFLLYFMARRAVRENLSRRK